MHEHRLVPGLGITMWHKTRYIAQHAWASVRAAPWLFLATVMALSAALCLLGLSILTALNIEQLTKHWGRGIHATVFLKSDVAPAQIKALHERLQTRPEVAYAKLISPEQALAQLAQHGGIRQQPVDASLLPTSIELRLRPSAAGASALLSMLGELAIVDDIEHSLTWSTRLGQLAETSRQVSTVLCLLIALVCVVIVYVAIRVAIYARRDELCIQQLVGATAAYVRAPFIIEAVLHGLFAAALSIAVTFACFTLTAHKIEAQLSQSLGSLSLQYFSTTQLTVGVLFSVLIAWAASHLAVGRYV